MFALVTALLASAPAADPLPAGSAVLVAHSVLKSEDGKHAVQLATLPATLLFSIFYGEGKGWRHADHDEVVASFKDAPAKDAAISMKFPGAEGWYRAETTVAKPKK